MIYKFTHISTGVFFLTEDTDTVDKDSDPMTIERTQTGRTSSGTEVPEVVVAEFIKADYTVEAMP